jgi:GntR family transcriptional regulator/MocR family aminotransferase
VGVVDVDPETVEVVLAQVGARLGDLGLRRQLIATAGLAPAPLSVWYASPAAARSGLLLGIATSPQKHLARSCDRLLEVMDRFR